MRYHSTPDIQLVLEGYRLTTAEIIYCLPDYPELLQTFIWQCFDLSPDFPRLHSFLNYWETHIEARLYSVSVAQAGEMGMTEARFAAGEFILH